jgi:U2-associated protein SR140
VDENIDGIPLEALPQTSSTGFVKSKWEELDPVQVQNQAITTTKWEFDPVAPEPPKISSICNYDNSSSSDESDTEEKRKRLREIENKVIEYQDELDSGKRSKKSGFSIDEQVEHFRRKLLRKADRNDSDSNHSTSDRYASSSSSKRDRNRRSSSSERRSKKPRRSASSEREKYHHSKQLRSRSPHSPGLSSKSSK